jgi:hypothetical protein
MASWMTRALMVATVGLGVGTFAAQEAVAQESTNQVAAITSWPSESGQRRIGD